MGDKSPKQKARQQKQDAAQKNQKSQDKADAYTKSHPAPTLLGKKTSK